MAVPKIVLFYVFTPLPDPEAIRLWQHTLAASNNLGGRIIISEHGINATVGGELADVKRYVRGTRSYPAFKDADIKWSEGLGEDFPRLSVKVRSEIVTFGAAEELKVDADGVVGGGVHLNPAQVNELVDRRGDDVVFFDGRNAFEAQIGKFKNAVVPEVDTTRDFLAQLDSGQFDHLKKSPVVTYCTGGVRCEVLSSLMRSRGFEEVYQLDGGIVRYAEAYGDDALWEGSLYVFDKRMKIDFSDHTSVIGRCTVCTNPTSRYQDFDDDEGRGLRLVCVDCA
ncbi:rhodanese-related sulfurtransferase [Rhodococcus sp. PAMC28707]|uniref:oxygen-dependent tRNA uridine(34) hydroxylase TrhO n=1 Tax=unclassified Rhodococcus (in: high G+C Gram-positive bacteria) TaxID=192944 RepID=UPI00109DFAB1|nr:MULTISPECIES: rhodanese-related sulfurtransferase [unclassified Rhodococcus (in: high G+C Gram-positive bacteria)]QCB52161.1 rhodanese-related sulfurtransferase [Rhodococcus sp. PAMC28705]QCB59669.1 rhodanese-related sulfurtransferase [Rhodococcus sp. PAMC28707]